ncbi:hypothetical protein GC197_12620 [bacterium]|nr:hypothetical protein [bacterium]
MSVAPLDTIVHPDFLEVVISGDASERDWVAVQDRSAELADATGKRRIYIDAAGVTNKPESMVLYRIGVRTGRTFRGSARIALLQPDWNTDNFWEVVANNSGAVAKLGAKRHELIQWLLEDS